MSSHMNYLMIEAQQSEVAERVRRAGLPAETRVARRQPSRLRTGSARLLIGLATRLDARVTPTAPRISPSGARS